MLGFKVTANCERKMIWPCESTHHITFSIDGVEPVIITLPFPVLLPSSTTLKSIALPRPGGIVEVVLEKTLHDLWPDDVISDRLRWNAEKLVLWTDVETLKLHLRYQFCQDYFEKKLYKVTDELVVLVREIIFFVFNEVALNGHERFQLKVQGSTDSPDWFIRAHPPVRTSPGGTPILLLSALDHHLQERLQSEGKLDIDRSKKSFHRIFGHVPAEEKVVLPIVSAEVAQLLRYVLRLNSTKIRPSSWQNENLPQGKSPSPWLATFVRPLYLDSAKCSSTVSKPATTIDSCAKCGKTGDHLKLCVRCKTVSYCSFDCRRADSSKHKRSCS